ncbi:MAG: hypothetical protein HC902_01460 [Calothrix sp. SM1_5_4]|nr:hypothetical protein [Calothrix sp. SM1_5_4]
MSMTVINELLRRANSDPKLKRKLKIFVATTLMAIILSGALAIWAGLTAIDYVTRTASALRPGNSVDIAGAIQTFNGEQALLQLGCLDRAKAMLDLAPWLERPLQQNLHEIIAACGNAGKDRR